ncbi:unnamed protein product [Ilex paraguariensis]|uniref:non-specific serine/threonine protein kinase n=1 Tax=Ilex paraguariensis TaxID=185542 RepID=A0ABC8SV07_9AQUA
MSTLIAIRDVALNGGDTDALYSPAKEKAANRGVYNGRSPLFYRRIRQLHGGAKIKLILSLFLLGVFVWFTSRLGSFMGWNPHYPSSVSHPSRGGYTVLINTWKRNSLLKQSVAHYASCSGTDAIHVVWSETDPPSENLKAYLNKIVFTKSQTAHKPNFRFDLNKEDNLNNRFKPIGDLRTDAIFSVDDDVIVPCSTLDFAFNVWQSAPLTMVGFVPRMHWLDEEKNGVTYYQYGGWWSVWWMGTYSMVLSKASFFHRKYLDLYSHKMPSSINDYVTRERNCEDIAMSLLVANATGAPPIWVKGKIYEIGSSGISSLTGHSNTRNKCLNDFVSLYGIMPLVSTNVKAVDSRHEWFCCKCAQLKASQRRRKVSIYQETGLFFLRRNLAEVSDSQVCLILLILDANHTSFFSLIMPSRQLSPQSPPLLTRHHQNQTLTPPLAAFSFLLLLTLCFRKSRKRTVPSPSSPISSKPPQNFSYSSLCRATSSFSASHLLGRGGFGSVYSATLKNHEVVAVKVLESGSLQGEREFQNELLLAGKINSNFIVSVLGFSSNPKRRRMLLVYELMSNGSLQDCLLHRKCVELKNWKKRFSIAVDIAKGLEYLHHCCDPPIIHGDIKPSNMLLDGNFSAKIGDFGLARLKSENQCDIEMKKGRNIAERVEDNGSVVEDTESVITTTCFEESNGGVDQSPESSVRALGVEALPETVVVVEASPEVAVVSPRTVAEMASPLEGFKKSTSVSDENRYLDKVSMDSGKRKKNILGKDWWWKQDNGGGESGSVKDYVMEWINTEIKKDRPNSEWIGASSSSGTVGNREKKKKKNRKQLDWWVSLDDEKNVKREKRRPPREWWKEEYCEELVRKKKKKKRQGGSVSDGTDCENQWPRDDELYVDKKKRSRSRNSWSSMDWWLDGISGELWRARGKSFDSVSLSGEMGKSSSTPSMRGTVCYTAPEYGGGDDVSEKCDVYSFGVLLLVLIAGRRPLQVTGSPMPDFHRANLLSWARRLAHAGKLLDLVDKSIESLDREQALVCITVALLCLQKSPARRPSMKEVVGMLTGDLEPPQLPVEFSPSPPSRHPLKPYKKVRSVRNVRLP